jgi:hypothetical protein
VLSDKKEKRGSDFSDQQDIKRKKQPLNYNKIEAKIQKVLVSGDATKQ